MSLVSAISGLRLRVHSAVHHNRSPGASRKAVLGQIMIEAYTDFQAWFHDRFVAERALNVHFHFLAQEGLEAVFAEKRARRVLDVGCGGGQTILLLKQRYPYLQLTGIDLSAAQIGWARERARHRHVDVDVQVGDAQALPFAEQSFDVLFSFGSVKHWPDAQQGIGECWRVLKPGGELLLLDSTSDASMDQVRSFFRVAKLPPALARPAAPLFHRFLVRPARPVAIYQKIAADLGMPPGTVTQPADMPAFLYRTRK